MNIKAIGINHETAPVNIREKVAFPDRCLADAYKYIREKHGIQECVIISTCNRMEIYVCDTGNDGFDSILSFLKEFHHLEQDIVDHIYFLSEEEAVEHLYLVASGLNSMVVGEDQILGQVKDAHQKAMELRASGAILNSLFRYAVTAAKKVKSATELSAIPLSVSSLAVKFIKKQFGDITTKSFFVLGLGKMSMIAVKNLKSEGAQDIRIANRTKVKALSFEEEVSGITVVDYEDRFKALACCDVVISSTSAPHYVITKENFNPYHDADKAVCFIDLSLPRDIDPEVGKLKNVTLFSLDDLQQASKENLESRLAQADEVRALIKNEIENFHQWLQCQDIYPVIKELKQYYNDIVDAQMERLAKDLKHLSASDRKYIETISRSMTRKIFRTPILRLKESALKGKGSVVRSVVTDLFDLHTKGRNQ